MRLIGKKTTGIAVALLLLLPACAQDTAQEDFSHGVSTVAGALAGQFIGFGSGSIVSRALSRATSTPQQTPGAQSPDALNRDALSRDDRIRAETVAQQALENSQSGHTLHWFNPATNSGGSFTPLRTIENEEAVCRDFSQSVSVSGKMTNTEGRACRASNGVWTITSLRPIAV